VNFLLTFFDPPKNSPPLEGEDKGEGDKVTLIHPSPSQRLSLRGRSPSLRAGGSYELEAGAEPEPVATLILPCRRGRRIKGGISNIFV